MKTFVLKWVVPFIIFSYGLGRAQREASLGLIVSDTAYYVGGIGAIWLIISFASLFRKK